MDEKGGWHEKISDASDSYSMSVLRRMSEKIKNRSSASAGDRSGKRNGIDGEDISSCR